MFKKKELKYNITIHFANEHMETYYLENHTTNKKDVLIKLQELADKIRNKDIEIFEDRLLNYSTVVSAIIEEIK